jgi:hypothetical protein
MLQFVAHLTQKYYLKNPEVPSPSDLRRIGHKSGGGGWMRGMLVSIRNPSLHSQRTKVESHIEYPFAQDLPHTVVPTEILGPKVGPIF